MNGTGMRCPRCGGTDCEYVSRINAYVCNECDHRFRSEADRVADEDYERKKGFARQHLAVGNWYEVRNILQPLCSVRPSDKELYLMLLMAVTKGYSDMLLHSEGARMDAADYWEKLRHLHCINGTMRRYARKRQECISDEKQLDAAKISIAVGISVLVTFITACMFMSRTLLTIPGVILSIVFWVISIRMFFNSRIYPGYGKYFGERYSDDNPFRE